MEKKRSLSVDIAKSTQMKKNYYLCSQKQKIRQIWQIAARKAIKKRCLN